MKKKLGKILNVILYLIYIVTILLFSYLLLKINIIPWKFLIIGYGLFAIFNLIFFLFLKKPIIKKTLMGIVSLCLIIVSIYLINTSNFLDSLFAKYATINYQIVTLKDSKHVKLQDLDNKVIGYLKDNEDDITLKLNEEINYEKEVSNEFVKLQELLYTKKVAALCLEDSYLNLINEEDAEFQNKTQSIYNFNVKIKVDSANANINISKNPFVLYISGIDQFGNVSSVRGRSDVNILAVVNPSTNKILLVNTPRDYYVQLDGTTGLKDKLTHAGIYGIDKSMKTLENLYNVDVNYYLRVNFDTLVKVVDIIDGIDVYSDSTFKPWTNSQVIINEGWNHFDGKEALAYARERKSYLTGDNHRGQNQQQIITAIIEKVTKSSVLISKYNDILKALDGSFQTNMEKNILTDFIKYQISKMPSWQVESVHVTGFDSSNYTYSMPNSISYVMEPNMKSVNEVKEKIQNILK